MIEFFKRNKKIIIPVLLVLGLVGAFFVFRPGSGNQQGQFQTVEVGRGNLVATVGATGTVRARQTAILVWQTTGTVEDVNVRIGDEVRADEVLASLSKSSLPQNIILAEADLVSAQRALDELLASDTSRAQALIALRNAEEDYRDAKNNREAMNYPIERTRVTLVTQVNRFGVPERVPKAKTYKSDATEEEIEDAEAKLALAEAKYEDAKRTYERLQDGPDSKELAAAEARVEAAQATLGLAELTAPFAGTVTEAIPLSGDQVAAGTRAFRVDDLSGLLVDVEVSEVDINAINVGQPVTLSFDAILGQEYQGEVSKVSQAGDVVAGVVNFTVTVELTDADERVKPGMTAAVNIVVREIEDAILVPNRAVRLVDGDRVVYILVAGMPEKVEIRLGASSDTMSVVVGGDLNEGDLVILNPPLEFQGGGGPPF